MFVNEAQLREFIKEAKVVPVADLEQFEAVADKEGISVGDILLKEQKITDDELRRIKAYVLGVPFVKLAPEKIDYATLALVPEPIAQTHNVIAYKKTETSIEVAMLDIDDLGVLDFIKKKLKMKIVPRLTDKQSIIGALARYKKSLKAEFDSIIQKESATFSAKVDKKGDPADEKDLKQLAEDLPIVKIVDTLISHAILQQASDIHIEPLEEELLVRYRIDGILHDVMHLPKDIASAVVARIKVLSNLKLDEKRLPQDGRFKISDDTQKVSFRVSTLPTYYGEKVVTRVLNESSYGFTLEGLGFHHEALDALHRAMKLANGMILICGPTGSGKTTTLYTMLDILNTPDVNISTVEDPIEYQMPRINQTQVKPEIGLTFANGLRSLLRQDPDMIMVGEIRDGETASLAINAALTGHLVLSTIHTNSAAGAIPRLIDMGAEPFLVASTVKTIISQRLVRRLGKNKEEYHLTDGEYQSLSRVVDMDRLLKYLIDHQIVSAKSKWSDVPVFRPKQGEGSEEGYSGRISIHEVLEITQTMRELINKNSPSNIMEDQAKKEGMLTMLEDGIIQAILGNTSIEEVLRVVSE